MRFTVGPHPCEQLIDFLILSLLLSVFHYGLTCIFPMNNDRKHIFMYLLAICRYFLVKCLFIILLFANIPFVITTYFAQDTLKLCIYSYFSSNLTSLVLATIGHLQQLLCSKGDFYFCHSFYI